MNQNDLLKEVIKKYGFHEPIPDEVQDLIPGITRRTLSTILKQEKKLGIMTRAAMAMMLKLRQLGMSISLARSSLLINTASFAATCAILVSAVYSVLTISVIPAAEQGYVISVIGDVSHTPAGKVERSLKVKDTVRSGDSIATAGKSQGTMQFGSEYIIHVEPDTKVLLSQIQKDNRNEISLTGGRLLLNYKKLRKGYIYNVKTPTAVASVRGTIFSISYNENKTIVAVKEGTVLVTTIDKSRKETIQAGKTAVITDIIVIKPTSRAQLKLLEKIEKIPFTEKIDKKDAEYYNSLDKKIQQIIRDIEKQHSALAPMSLADIRKKYGRIDVLTMYNGRKIMGIILGRQGAIYKMLTPRGPMNIHKSKIKTKSVQ